MFHREKGIDCKSVSDRVLEGEVEGSRGGQLGGGTREGDGKGAAGSGLAPAPGTQISTR